MMPIIYLYHVSSSGDCDTSRSAVSRIRIVQGAISRNVSEPAFVPQFHGFEMFVWSLLSPEVLLSCLAASASYAIHSQLQVPLQSQVTWVSQMTSDRVLALKQLLLAWKGPVSIAV